ncbi:hypothetical protein ACOMHN_055434 [Nucella lapillus]
MNTGPTTTAKKQHRLFLAQETPFQTWARQINDWPTEGRHVVLKLVNIHDKGNNKCGAKTTGRSFGRSEAGAKRLLTNWQDLAGRAVYDGPGYEALAGVEYPRKKEEGEAEEEEKEEEKEEKEEKEEEEVKEEEKKEEDEER